MLQHIVEAYKYFSSIEDGAANAKVPSAFIYGIGSRESGWGLLLKPKGPSGTGDKVARKYTKKFRPGPLPPDGLGYGRGLMQIDYDAHPFARMKDDWKDPALNIAYGCGVLRNNISFLGKRSDLQFTEASLLIAAIAAFNCGAGNVIKSLAAGDDVDARTAHHNYSQDVVARAAWFDAVGGWAIVKGVA